MKSCYVPAVLGLLMGLSLATTGQARVNPEASQLLEEGLAIGLESSVLEGLLELEAEAMDSSESETSLRLKDNDLS